LHFISKQHSPELLLRKEAARRLRVSCGTLAVWDCVKRYDLRPICINGRIFYRKSDLIRYLLKSNDLHVLDEPLLTRQEAAEYLDTTCGTLAVWDCVCRYDLNPLKVGACVRYSRNLLRTFLYHQMVGKPLARTFH
jgi:hypothetical protein